MKQADWNHYILNEIDPELVEGAAAPAKKHSLRPVRIAVAAACICAALVGGAFAAEAIFGVPIFKPKTFPSIDGSPVNGFTVVIEQPDSEGQPDDVSHVNPMDTFQVNGVFKLPDDVLSETVLALAEQYNKSFNSTQLNASDWTAAEELIGMELMNNTVLDGAKQVSTRYKKEADGTLTPYGHCYATVFGYDQAITCVTVDADYLLNDIHVDVHAKLYTKNSPIAADDLFDTYGFPDDYTFTTETYTTPNGLIATIVGVHRPDNYYGTCTDYYALFAWNKAAFHITSIYTPDGDLALATLKQVLDAVE